MAKNQKYKQRCFGHSVIEVWNLFEIWILGFGISGLFQM
jgi:hypothetical protein